MNTVLDVSCPVCGAKKNRVCKTASGKRLSREKSHAHRKLNAPGVQLGLIDEPIPPIITGVDLRLCDVMTLARDPALHGTIRLVHADPPWLYDNIGVNGAADKQYGGLPIPTIIEHLDAAYDLAEDDAYLLMWCTCPIQREWFIQEAAAFAVGKFRWIYKSGGAWGKRLDEERDRKGSGTHMRGDTEVPFLYVKGKPRPYYAYLTNWCVTDRPKHSEKPVGWLREVVRCLVRPEGRVVDFYSGRGSMARAAWSEQRDIVCAELDPKRYEAGRGALAHYVYLHPRVEAVMS